MLPDQSKQLDLPAFIPLWYPQGDSFQLTAACLLLYSLDGRLL